MFLLGVTVSVQEIGQEWVFKKEILKWSLSRDLYKLDVTLNALSATQNATRFRAFIHYS